MQPAIQGFAQDESGSQDFFFRLCLRAKSRNSDCDIDEAMLAMLAPTSERSISPRFKAKAMPAARRCASLLAGIATT